MGFHCCPPNDNPQYGQPGDTEYCCWCQCSGDGLYTSWYHPIVDIQMLCLRCLYGHLQMAKYKFAPNISKTPIQICPHFIDTPRRINAGDGGCLAGTIAEADDISTWSTPATKKHRALYRSILPWDLLKLNKERIQMCVDRVGKRRWCVAGPAQTPPPLDRISSPVYHRLSLSPLFFLR